MKKEQINLSAPPLSEDIELTLLVPVRNEGDNIIPFVLEISEKVAIPFVMCVVYDHEDDNTIQRKEEVLAILPNTIFVKNVHGPGIINAFKTGFSTAQTKYIVPIMADLSDTPETINSMYRKICEGYDLVIASRYAPGGKKIGGPVFKYYLSLLGNFSLHWLTGIPTHDMTNAFIMHKKEVLDRICIRSTGGFEITMEIIAKSFILGSKITEVPTINRDRASGQSNFQLMSWIMKYVYWYLYILIYSVVNKINQHYEQDTKKN